MRNSLIFIEPHPFQTNRSTNERSPSPLPTERGKPASLGVHTTTRGEVLDETRNTPQAIGGSYLEISTTKVTKSFLIAFIYLFALLTIPITAQDLPNPDAYEWAAVVDGFDNPLYITHAGDDSGRLFVVEQNGFILIVEDGTYNPDPFLDISSLLPREVFQGRYTERGLLGLAFHPDFADNGTFFINYTEKNGDSVIARYTTLPDDPSQADPDSATVLLTIEQPYDNHNAGHMVFGTDGYLYIGAGDGGSRGDPDGSGQNTRTLTGTIMRLDVDAETYTIPEDNPFIDDSDYQSEIWAYGLRNPWRFSFDRATGDLYIGEVGQEQWEEINFQPAESPGGENYGWNRYEAETVFNEETVIDGDVTMPIITYAHDIGCSVTGGYVYRGEALPELNGIYFYGDYCSGNVWSAVQDDDGEWQTALFSETPYNITSFGEDEAGELYIVDYKGGIYRLQAKDAE